MAPTNLVRSIQAYARSLRTALKAIDDILARMPSGEGATPSSSLIKELETAKAEAKVKFEKLDANYLDQQAELPDDQEQAHTKAYEDAVKDYDKTMQKANATLDAQPSGSASVTVQAVRPPARIIEDLKPTEKLTSTMSLEAFRAWAEQYRQFMKQNTKAFEEQGLETARAYLTKAIGPKLAMRLKTMRDDAGTLKLKDDTTRNIFL